MSIARVDVLNFFSPYSSLHREESRPIDHIKGLDLGDGALRMTVTCPQDDVNTRVSKRRMEKVS